MNQNHNEIKRRIAAGELVDYEIYKNYKDMGMCYVLIFSTRPFKRVVRCHEVAEYLPIMWDALEKRGV